MNNIWTFTPLQNKREYNEDEKTILEYFFTNIDKNIYCAKNTLSNQLWAFLVGQYSRSSLSMRDRFLQLFDDAKKALEKWIIWNEDYISLTEIANSIRNSESLNLDFFEKKASDFLKKWWVDYGHNSLKDADRIRFAIEWVSQAVAKIIESPFPALWDFQEKSTRYLDFWKDNLIYPPDLESSEYIWEIKVLHEKLISNYLKYLPIVKESLVKNGIINEKDFSSYRVFERTLNAKAFDIVRYLLPSNISTSLWASFSTRILETHLSYMLSHPLEEVRLIASNMLQEALKLSPWLLSHVWVNEYIISIRDKIRNYIDDLITEDKKEIYAWIKDSDRVKIIFEWNFDNNICACILFENARGKGVSYNECLKIVEKMNDSDKEDLMRLYLQERWPFDRMPRALQHSTIMFEFLVDFWAYRDIQRHRASYQLRQWATAIHGYAYPEYIDLMEDFKKDYDEVMTRITILSKKIIKKNPYLSEYVCALGHLVRTTFEMNPGQLAYVIEQRTTPWGHESYRRLFIEAFKQFEKISPIFSKFIRVWQDTESSRKIQEEKAEAKRQKFNI